MSIFDLFGLDLNELSLFLQRWHIDLSPVYIQVAVDIIVWGLLLLALWKKIVKPTFIWFWGLLPCSNKKRRSEYIHANLDHDFKDYLGKKNQGEYIETHFVSYPPHEYDEPNKATTASTRESMTSFCERIFQGDNPNERLYMVLAGSGMGKTTFMVNIFCHYVKTKMTNKGLPFEIRLLRLDDENVINKINDISKVSPIRANKTILLLDALDENRYASEDFQKFQTELESAIEPFKLVMITCRSQFFDSEKLIPEETSWISTGREKNLINYNKVYISPFSDNDIEKYLSQKYKGQRKKRKQAYLTVERCKNLMVRPLLLSYIDDLIEDNVKYTELSDIYETLIDKWLQREVNSIYDKVERNKQKKNLYRFSVDIAKTIYSNWKGVKSMQLTPEQMGTFMKSYGYNDLPFDIKRRSLINRNASGSFKFAHKSFLEYFLAKELFVNPSFELEFDGMDMAKTVYQGLCANEFRNQKNNGVFEIIYDKRFEKNIKLCINKTNNVNYIHTYVALAALNIEPVIVSFHWGAFSTDLYQFLDNIKVVNVEIKGYKNTSGVSPKSLLSISTLNFIKFESPETISLPKSYINEARKFAVTTIFNDEIVTTGTQYVHLPILSNVDYQLYRRIHQLVNDDTRNSRKLIDYIFNEIESK